MDLTPPSSCFQTESMKLFYPEGIQFTCIKTVYDANQNVVGDLFQKHALSQTKRP